LTFDTHTQMGQLSLAHRPWLGAVSTDNNSAANKHSTTAHSTVSK